MKPGSKRLFFKIQIILLLCLLPHLSKADELRLGYVKGGLYEEFVSQVLKDLRFDNFKLVFVPTEGSREQIELLRNRAIDLGVIQGDIAYYSHEGARGYEKFDDFFLVLPLFDEYLQVIVRSRHARGPVYSVAL